jgi:hypothetical protein
VSPACPVKLGGSVNEAILHNVDIPDDLKPECPAACECDAHENGGCRMEGPSPEPIGNYAGANHGSIACNPARLNRIAQELPMEERLLDNAAKQQRAPRMSFKDPSNPSSRAAHDGSAAQCCVFDFRQTNKTLTSRGRLVGYVTAL